MYEVLMEIMEPRIKLREDKIRKEGIQGTINALRDLGHENMEIKATIIKIYKLSENEADEYL